MESNEPDDNTPQSSSSSKTNTNNKQANSKIRSKRMMKGGKFYAVAKGRQIGIFTKYEGPCFAAVQGFSKPAYKGFAKLEEAVHFMNNHRITNSEITVYTSETVYSRGAPSVATNPYTLHDFCEGFGCPIPSEMMPTPELIASDDAPVVHVDGACLDNGQASAQGGVGVFWGTDCALNISCKTPNDGTLPTNNRAELYAAIAVVLQAHEDGIRELTICSDSEYVVLGMTERAHGWRDSGELDTRINSDLWMRLLELTDYDGLLIHWKHIRGHSGVAGNVDADRLAELGARQGVDWEATQLHKASQAYPPSVLSTSQSAGAKDAAGTPCGTDVSKDVATASHRADTGAATAENNDGTCNTAVIVSMVAPTRDPAASRADDTSNTSKIAAEPVHLLSGQLSRGADKGEDQVSANVSSSNVTVNVQTDEHPKQQVSTKADICQSCGPDTSTSLGGILQQVSKQLAELSDFRKVTRELETSFVDRLLQEKDSATHHRLEAAQTENKTLQKEITRLSKLLQEKENLSKQLSSKVAELEKGLDDQRTPVMLLSEYKELQKAHGGCGKTITDLEAKPSDRELQNKETSSALTLSSRERQSFSDMLQRSEEALEGKLRLIQQLENQLATQQSRIVDLSDEVLSWKLSQQESHSTAPYCVVGKGRLEKNKGQDVTQNGGNSTSGTEPEKTLSGTQEETGAAPANVPQESAVTARGPNPVTSVSSTDSSVGATNSVAPAANTDETGRATGAPNSMPSRVNLCETVGSVPAPKITTRSKEVDVLIISNSHTSKIQSNRLFRQRTCYVRTLAYGKKTIEGAADFIEECELTPKFIILQVASNNLVREDVTTCLGKMVSLVAKIRTKFPGASILASQALPRRMDTPAGTEMYGRKVREFNSRLPTLNTTVISHESLTDSTAWSNGIFSEDGVHLSRKGVGILVGNYKWALHSLTGQGPSMSQPPTAATLR